MTGSRSATKVWASLRTTVIVCILWSGATLFSDLLPTVLETVGAAIDLVSSEAGRQHITATLRRVAIATVLAAVAGITLGLGMGLSNRLREFAHGPLRFVMGIPALTWILVVILLVRVAEYRILWINFIIAFPVVALNTMEGVRGSSQELDEMLRSFRPSPKQRLKHLVLPSMAPSVIVGLEVAISLVTRVVVFAELLGASVGIGAGMNLAFQRFELDVVIAWGLITVLVLVIVDRLIAVLRRRMMSWRVEIAK